MAKTFLITGVSSGLGRTFAEAALAAGHTVLGTVRTEEARRAFRGRGVLLDLASPDADVLAALGREPVDVLVNNAGYGHEGTLEESSLDELRHQLAVNVVGPVAMMKAVLPGMRSRRRGHIVNVTSMGGMITLPGISFYCGSKHALEGISESVGKEVAQFGIHVTALAPGQFRTDWAGRSMVRANRSIPEYDALFDPIRKGRQAKSGKQPGDPAKAARALLELVEMDDPPKHLLLGKDALAVVRDKLNVLAMELDRFEAISASTDFEERGERTEPALG